MVILRSELETSTIKCCSDHVAKQENQTERPLTECLENDSRVRFGENEVFYRTQQQLCVPPSSLWYSPTDYATFRASFKSDAKKMAQENKISTSRGQVVIRAFERSTSDGHLDETSTHELSLYFQDGERTGLERWASKKVYADSRLRKKRLNEAVDEVQMCDFVDEELEAAFIRDECERLSRPSVLFARYLAKAVAAESSIKG
jgi:hypothetical protein